MINTNNRFNKKTQNVTLVSDDNLNDQFSNTVSISADVSPKKCKGSNSIGYQDSPIYKTT